MSAVIRLATPDDARGVQEIYAPVVRETAISFELEPPTVEEMQQRIVKALAHMPWLVCEHVGDILGYVYASLSLQMTSAPCAHLPHGTQRSPMDYHCCGGNF